MRENGRRDNRLKPCPHCDRLDYVFKPICRWCKKEKKKAYSLSMSERRA